MWTNYHSIALHYRTVIGPGVSAWDGVAEENWVVIDNMIKTNSEEAPPTNYWNLQLMGKHYNLIW